MSRVGLFIPCYVDQLYPQVGLATVEILERCGYRVEYPVAQTCCGQPMANTGCTGDARPLAEQFVRLFEPYDYVVGPSGSCVSMIRHHYEEFFPDGTPLAAEYAGVRAKTFELCEFLTDVVKLERWDRPFPYRVGLHQSCHGLRELRLGSSSEMVVGQFSKPRSLLELLEGITLVELERRDECCGFGGTFAVSEEAVSCAMGQDRIADHMRAGAEILTANDMSCLMHLEGLIRRDRQPLRVMHIAEILAGHAV